MSEEKRERLERAAAASEARRHIAERERFHEAEKRRIAAEEQRQKEEEKRSAAEAAQRQWEVKLDEGLHGVES